MEFKLSNGMKCEGAQNLYDLCERLQEENLKNNDIVITNEHGERMILYKFVAEMYDEDEMLDFMGGEYFVVEEDYPYGGMNASSYLSWIM